MTLATSPTTEDGIGVTNRCKQDRERRERAWTDCGLTEKVGNMERTISFEVGYDHRSFPEDCGGGGHGQHGMSIRFVLKGPAGAVQWLVNMHHWVPGNVHYGHVETTDNQPVSLVPLKYPQVGDGMATDLGYHSPREMYEGQYGPREDCEYIDGPCWYDGSGLNAEPILEAFLSHGPHAVWAALARYYMQTFGAADDAE